MKRAAELDQIRAAAKKRQLQYLREKYGKSCQTQVPIEIASQTQDAVSKTSQTRDPIETANQTQDPIETDSQTQDPSSQVHIPFHFAYTNRCVQLLQAKRITDELSMSMDELGKL